MIIFVSVIPIWISIIFLACFLVPIYMIVSIVRKTVNQTDFDGDSNTNRLPKVISVFYAAYYLYVTLMSFTGVFDANTLPPRILLFTALPLLVFYFFYVFRSKIFWRILQNVELADLVRIHIFRLVGVFFLIFWAYGALPKSFAFIAGIGDILVAITAIFVAMLIDNKAKNYKRITLIWNIIGFWDIVSVIVSAIVTTKMAIETQSSGLAEMAKFPFSLLPAFAPATIIFLHICIFKKLKMQNN